MDNLQPVSHLDPKDVPEGFSVTDPNAAPGAAAQPQGASAADAAQQKQAILEQALTPDALARLNRIKLVKPERAAKLSQAIAGMAVQGQLPGRISEGKLIEMLERGSARDARASSQSSGAAAGNNGGIRIQRKKYAMDSDEDDDDNDDDLVVRKRE